MSTDTDPEEKKVETVETMNPDKLNITGKNVSTVIKGIRLLPTDMFWPRGSLKPLKQEALEAKFDGGVIHIRPMQESENADYIEIPKNSDPGARAYCDGSVRFSVEGNQYQVYTRRDPKITQ